MVHVPHEGLVRKVSWSMVWESQGSQVVHRPEMSGGPWSW